MRNIIPRFGFVALSLIGCSSPGSASKPPECEMYAVLSETPVKPGEQCGGLVDGSACLTLGTDPVRLQMRDLALAQDEVGYPCLAFSLTDAERDACNALARTHPGGAFVLVHGGKPYRRFYFAGATPSMPSMISITPGSGHWTPEEAEHERRRFLGDD